MKASEHLRQNQKFYRHASKKAEELASRPQPTKFLGKFLPALPGVPPMLHEVRRQFNIPDVRPGGDSSDQITPGGWPLSVEGKVR